MAGLLHSLLLLPPLPHLLEVRETGLKEVRIEEDCHTLKEGLGLFKCLGEAIKDEPLVLAGLGEEGLGVELQHILFTVATCAGRWSLSLALAPFLSPSPSTSLSHHSQYMYSPSFSSLSVLSASSNSLAS